jgi:hypothetical protein
VPARHELIFFKLVGAIEREEHPSNMPADLQSDRESSLDLFQFLFHILERLEALRIKVVRNIPSLCNLHRGGSVHGEIRCNMQASIGQFTGEVA